MSFNLNVLAEGVVSQEVVLSEGVTVTIRELPVGLLLKFKRVRGLLSSAAARFTQTVPLGSQTLTNEKIPIDDSEGNPTDKFMTTEVSQGNRAEMESIDKSVELRERAIIDAMEVLLDDVIIYDVLQASVLEFSELSKDELFDIKSGLTFRHMKTLLTAIVEINGIEIDRLGNFFSRLQPKKE